MKEPLHACTKPRTGDRAPPPQPPWSERMEGDIVKIYGGSRSREMSTRKRKGKENQAGRQIQQSCSPRTRRQHPQRRRKTSILQPYQSRALQVLHAFHKKGKRKKKRHRLGSPKRHCRPHDPLPTTQGRRIADDARLTTHRPRPGHTLSTGAAYRRRRAQRS